MSKNYAMTAKKRDRAGKGIARSLRREGKLPAVVYGDNKDPVLLTLSSKDVNLEYQKGHMYTTLCDLNVDGEKMLVLARDVQLHPVSDFAEHVDFLRVTPKTKLKVNVPVHFTNYEESEAGKAKGVLNIVRHEVELMCSATHIPEYVEVDLTPFAIGDSVKISNAVLTEGATPTITDRDFTLATIMAPKSAAAAEAEEAAAAEEGAAEDGEGEAAEEAAE